MPTISKDIYSSIFNILHSEAFASTVQQLPKNDYMLFYDVVNEKMVFVRSCNATRRNDSCNFLALKFSIEQKYSYVFLGKYFNGCIELKHIQRCALDRAFVNLPEFSSN
jgi:hypothetical protein